MKTLLLGLVAGATIATAAAAQYGAPPPPGRPMPGGPMQGGPMQDGPRRGGWNRDGFWRGAPMGAHERIQFLQDRINRGIGDGSLDRREARNALRELDGIRRMDRDLHYRDHGRLNPGDEQAVQDRLDNLSRRIRWMRHNGW